MIKFKEKERTKKTGLVIAVDFDSTVVKDKWPRAGDDVPGAVEVIKRLQQAGHKIILLTQREHVQFDGEPDVLNVALEWFASRGIELFAINDNPRQLENYYESRKVYADLYVDDHCAGIPLVDYVNESGDHVPYVDWKTLESWLEKNDYL